MPNTASELARCLAGNAEAVCRYYLSNGYRQGRYWLVGDVGNSPGRSMYVRLHGPDSGRGAAGKWTDAATGQHGDLLDLIAANRGLDAVRDILDEARTFLSLPKPEVVDRQPPAPAGSPEAARRLFAGSKRILGTVAETYLRERGIITDLRSCTALRFHPRCFYRHDGPAELGARDDWPAIIASITDIAGNMAGAHRTWLDPSGRMKAQVPTPRRAMGNLLGNAVRFGKALDVMALSANHLAALVLPTTLRRLYIARDNDPAGRRAAETLAQRTQGSGIDAMVLTPTMGDFNDDLRQLGAEALIAAIRVQLAPDDVARFWKSPGQHRGSG
jgi:hypothetical protein